ncbi:MAG TPA: ACP phosphodiesterase [Geobacterales bacterium]|nr:ACP phosphodiesterase [Geobacterales bacterium]
MNYLFHLFLADDQSPEERLGTLMGDFAKGSIPSDLPLRVQEGIRLHRLTDAAAQVDSSFHDSAFRLTPSLHHYRPLIIDIFYDHLLAVTWSSHHPLPLPIFSEGVYADLALLRSLIPPNMVNVTDRMAAQDWLSSYVDQENIGRALAGVSRRLRHPVDLTLALPELNRHYHELLVDFRVLLPRLQLLVAGARRDLSEESG